MSLRVIGGSCKGRRLSTVRGMTTRPTSDRVRESIFNILSGRISEKVVVDLFAGTGALGIEALSRGAARALFVDHSRQALAIIGKNLTVCGLDPLTSIVRWDIRINLTCLKREKPAPDLVFMDPPYHRGYEVKTLTNLHAADILPEGAVVVVEHAAADDLPENVAFFYRNDYRRYGDTAVSFFTYNGR